ncbi:MAG: hypothetical protein VB099_11275 [Candidatus Limiplasma sp.]|nr:hypothetical protein [Candidatus Limiplasma sp.]
MLCKMKPNTKTWFFIMGVGLVSLAFGLLAYLLPSAGSGQPHLDTLLGMFSGFGAGLMAVALFKLIRGKLISPQKREEEEIQQQDERTLAVTRAAHTVGFFAGAAMLAILIFLFTYLNDRLASYLCLGALYVQMIVFLVAYRVYNKKM